jgi:hypothetical protein
MQPKIPLLEQFGIYVIKMFGKYQQYPKKLLRDLIIQQKVRIILFWSMALVIVVSALAVYPLVKIDLYYTGTSLLKHYGVLALATIGITIVEIFLLFIISLWAVQQLSALVPNKQAKAYLQTGPFKLIHVLSRTALELNEPVIDLFGIDPFKQISKRNLLVLSLLYKLKILLSNVVLKYGLLLLVGEKIGGISILYEAVLVEIFWNARIIYKVIIDARLKIFGFYIANTITEKETTLLILQSASPLAQEACIRAIANSVVMTRNYHANMIVLLFEFYENLDVSQTKKIDNWDEFLTILNSLPTHEKNMVLDVLCIAIAFDGHLSNIEAKSLEAAFVPHLTVYTQRINNLILALQSGAINKALLLCEINTIAG